MRLPLLLVALGWCSLVAAQDLAVDYDYYDLGVEEAASPAADETLAAAEDAPLSPDEPAEAVPVTEAPSEKTTTTEADLKGRKKLVSVVRPGGLDRRRRPSTSNKSPSAGSAGTTTTTTEQPSTGVRGGSSRFRRPSRQQQSEAQTDSTTEATTPARSFSRNRFRSSSSSSSSASPTSSSSSSSSGFSPRRTSGRSSATTEAPADTTHRFSPRRRFRPQGSTSTNNEEPQEETATQAAANRFGRRRQK